MRKEIKQLKKALEAEGYSVDPTRGGHLKVTHPDKDGVVFMPSTPSDHRSIKNTKAELKRRFGFGQ